MRDAILRRDISGDEGTLGLLQAPNMDLVHIMEPPWRGNRRSISCIPFGAYTVVPHISPRFGRCLLVMDVPNRSHILVHAGNVGGDTGRGFHTHTHGCLLPGLRRGAIKVKGRRQAAVLSSRPAFRRLIGWAGDRPFRLEVINV